MRSLRRFLQRPARRLDGAAFDLVHHAVGVDGRADIDGDAQAPHAQLLGRMHFGQHGAPGAIAFVARKAQAEADAFFARCLMSRHLTTRGPAAARSHGVKHGQRARVVLQVRAAQGQWVGACGVGDLVDEALGGEDVGESAERAQRRAAPPRHHRVALHAPLREVVAGHGVALGTAAARDGHVDGCGWREGTLQRPAAEQGRRAAAARAAAVAGAPEVVLPVDDPCFVAIAGHVSLQLHDHRRPHGCVAQLVSAAPLHAQRAAGHSARKPGGVKGHVVGAVVAVAAGARCVCHRHAGHVDAKGQRQVTSKVKDALAVRPDAELRVALPLRDGARRGERGVSNPWLGVARGEGLRRLIAFAAKTRALVDQARRGRQALQVLSVLAGDGRRLPAQR